MAFVHRRFRSNKLYIHATQPVLPRFGSVCYIMLTQTHLITEFSDHVIKWCLSIQGFCVCIFNFFFIIYPEMELLSHMATAQLFEKLPDCFPNSPHSSQKIIIICSFSLQSFCGCEVVSHWGFALYDPDDEWLWSFFRHLSSDFHISFGRKNGLEVLCLLCYCFSERQSLVAKDDLVLLILQPPPHKCWNYRPVHYTWLVITLYCWDLWIICVVRRWGPY